MKNTQKTNIRLAMNARSLATLFITLGLALLTGTSVKAQDQQTTPSFSSGPYDFMFNLLAGYQNVTLAGQSGDQQTVAEERYEEALNLQSGLTIGSFNLFGERKRDSVGVPLESGMFDELYMNADGIGQPFTNASIRMREFHTYDLQIDFHNAKYFLDRPDSLYAGLHSWDDTRHFLNGSLTVNATDQLDLKLAVNSTGHTGSMTTTGAPYFEVGSSPDDRADFYWLNTPVNDQTNDYSLQAMYKISSTSVTIGGGYRDYNQTISYSPVNDTSLTYSSKAGVPNFAGVVGNYVPGFGTGYYGTTAVSHPLISYMWDQTLNGKTPYVYGQVVSKPINDLTIVADARYEQTTYTSAITGAIDGVVSSTNKKDTAVGGVEPNQNYSDNSTGSANDILKTLTTSLTVTGKASDQITLSGMWRFTHVNESDAGLMSETYDTMAYNGTGGYANQVAPLVNGVTTVGTSIPTHFFKAFVNVTPMDLLNLRVGAEYTVMVPSYNENIYADSASGALTTAAMTEKYTNLEPFFNFWYEPVRDWKFEGRYSHAIATADSNGTSNQVDLPIRRDPAKEDKYSIAVDNKLTSDLNWSLRYSGTNGSTNYMDMVYTVENPSAGLAAPELVDKMQDINGTISYRLDRTTSAYFSYDYRKNDFTIPSTFTRFSPGVIPVGDLVYGNDSTVSIDQHTIDRTLDLTVTTKPVDGLHIAAGITYLRSTGGATVTEATTTLSTSDTISAKNPVGPNDVTKVGGPYTWVQAHAQVGYDIMKNLGIQLDWQYAELLQDNVDSYISVNNFVGFIYRASVYFKF